MSKPLDSSLCMPVCWFYYKKITGRSPMSPGRCLFRSLRCLLSPVISALSVLSRLLFWLHPFSLTYSNPSPAPGTTLVDFFVVCPDSTFVVGCTQGAHRCPARPQRGCHAGPIVSICPSSHRLPDAACLCHTADRLLAFCRSGCHGLGGLGTHGGGFPTRQAFP